MPGYAYAILALGWIILVMPFLLAEGKSGPAARIDPRARWGILMIAVAYSLLWQGHFWLRPPGIWRVSFSTFFFALASLLSWTGASALGRHWRIDAGLNADHKLVQSGPYRFVRHPIYTSMLSHALATALILSTPLPLLLPSALLMIIGTEIRVRTEDKLLASQFGGQFTAYRSGVPAYIPFLK